MEMVVSFREWPCFSVADYVEEVVEFAKLKGKLNIALLDYYEENPDKLDPMYHDHPWVAHLYERNKREKALDELTKQAQDLDMGY